MVGACFPLILIYPLRIKFLERRRPDSRLSMVVFPEPEGPMIAVTVLG
jgi:hypothetical protein